MFEIAFPAKVARMMNPEAGKYLSRSLRAFPASGAVLSALCVAAPSVGAENVAPSRVIEILMAPDPVDAHGDVAGVDIELRIGGLSGVPRERLLKMALQSGTDPMNGDKITDLVIADAKGALNVSTQDVTEVASQDRYWIPDRATSGQITVKYRVPFTTGKEQALSPQYKTYSGDGGFSGAGEALLMVPADSERSKVRVRWRLPSGSTGLSSFGAGDSESKLSLSPAEIDRVYFMAGRIGTYVQKSTGFVSGWQGKPGFDPLLIMTWTERLSREYGKFFGYVPDNFSAFARKLTANPNSGNGLYYGFVFTYSPENSGDPFKIKTLLAHEMVHSWVDSLDEIPGVDELTSSWFGEGLASYYEMVLPYQAGLFSSDDFLKILNSTAGRYYSNIKINIPNDQIAPGFWRDTLIRVLPYDRGALYFATVDDEIRKASNGKRSLASIVRPMLAQRRAGGKVDMALWLRLLHEQLGERGVNAFHAMLAGQTILPASDAFGPCFRRGNTSLRRFDLGFDTVSLSRSPMVIDGLKPGSEAERAGLKDGDIILEKFPQDSLQSDQNRQLTLSIQRNGAEMLVRYLPRGERVSTYLWEKVATCPSGKLND
ncbi:M61 family metallopeptidase [Sphingobium sp. JAI105]|uniref:M61 family metallopeptidase n=2 Tax=Sphingobium TaxID=165695 RepID=UPI0018C9C10B